MSTTNSPTVSAATTPGGCALPPRVKVLYITSACRGGAWLAEALATDSATEILWNEVDGVAAGLARLREEVFDVVLASHIPGELDALELVEGLRAGGHEEPMLLLGNDPPEQLDALCYEVGADDYCCINESSIRGLLWKIARAIYRHKLVSENRRLVLAEKQRLQQEHFEAERLLEQQRALINDLEFLGDDGKPPANNSPVSVEGCLAKTATADADTPVKLPEPLVAHYRELLRTYVIMGAGNLSSEMQQLADLLADSHVSAQRTMQLHVEVLEELVQSLGNRSARHVMNRADLLVLEVMGHLTDVYLRRSQSQLHPPQQLPLPGFRAAA